MRSIFCYIFFFALSVTYGQLLESHADSVSEIQKSHSKAELIYDIASNVNWKNIDITVPVRIAVVGTDAIFEKELIEVFKGKKAYFRAFEVQKFNSVAEVSNVDIIFVDCNKIKDFQILDKLK